VHQQTVETHGAKWTEPGNIVTNGPFELAGWQHDASITLVKNADWRNADKVALDRVEGRIIVDGTTRVQAFEAGEVDLLDGGGLPPADMPRLKELPEYEKYPALGTYYYGFNLKNIPDENQRRAMAFAIDRQSIIDNVAQADQIPATGMVPKGIPGFEVIEQHFLPTTADLEKAKEFMAKAENPKKTITLFYNDSPGHKEIAVAVQAMWKELGIDTTIKSQEFAQFLEFLGPPPNNAVDVYRLGWIADYGDPMNFLELWTSQSGNNNSNFADPAYDRLIEKARNTPNDQQRYELYRQAEAMLTGPQGALPIAPIYWYTYTNLERESVKDTFHINPLDQFDLSKVVIKEYLPEEFALLIESHTELDRHLNSLAPQPSHAAWPCSRCSPMPAITASCGIASSHCCGPTRRKSGRATTSRRRSRDCDRFSAKRPAHTATS